MSRAAGVAGVGVSTEATRAAMSAQETGHPETRPLVASKSGLSRIPAVHFGDLSQTSGKNLDFP